MNQKLFKWKIKWKALLIIICPFIIYKTKQKVSEFKIKSSQNEKPYILEVHAEQMGAQYKQGV